MSIEYRNKATNEFLKMEALNDEIKKLSSEIVDDYADVSYWFEEFIEQGDISVNTLKLTLKTLREFDKDLKTLRLKVLSYQTSLISLETIAKQLAILGAKNKKELERIKNACEIRGVKI